MVTAFECLIAYNNKVSQSFYGIKSIETLDFNIDSEKLKNLKFISFDYNSQCKTSPSQLSQLNMINNDEMKENANPEV